MKASRLKLPKYITRCLWSYEASSIDAILDQDLIITQVLNYGDWKAVKWLYTIYSEKEIRKVIARPRRGLWLKQVLNFWCLMLKIKLPHDVQERAIFHLSPEGMEQEAKMTKRSGRRAASTPGIHPGL